jgi:tetratricopeptide (TPR) repeat protein
MAEDEVNAHIERGRMLAQGSHPDLAEKEYRQALALQPDSAYAHALLADVLRAQKRYDEALAEADESVHLAPEWGYVHYSQSFVLEQAVRPLLAEQSAREAIRLDPENADYRAQLASIMNWLGRYDEGLAEAEAGLKIDPENVESLHQKSIALRCLGRREEAHRTLRTALTLDPENARSQASQGWNCLGRSDYGPALNHFREALRLDPGLEYAREGLVEALKAQYLSYRLVIRYLTWAAGLGKRIRWLLFIGVLLVFLLGTHSAHETKPGANIALLILGMLYALFWLVTWLTRPTFNLALRLSRFGRHALTKEETTAANWFGGFIAATVEMLIVGGILGSTPLLLLGAWCGAMILPVGVGLNLDATQLRRRRLRALALVVLGGLGLSAWVLYHTCPMPEAALPLIPFIALYFMLTAAWGGRLG